MSVVAASASHGVVVSGRRRKLQEFGQCCRASAVHGRTHRRLDRFQIQSACLAPPGENNPQQLVYFARDLLADCFRRFFSWSVDGSSWVGPQATDLGVGVDKLTAELLEFAELGNF